MLQIFSYYVWSVIAANQIVVYVKFTAGQLAQIVVMVKQQKKQQQLQHNALEPQKKECDARRRQPIQMDDAICINQVKKKMNTDLLFAIDTNTKEVIVSESPKGTNKVNFIERIDYSDNEILYNAVVTLTSITKASNFDASVFKSMDKVCQMLYSKYKN